jgi:hypothetical protein
MTVELEGTYYPDDWINHKGNIAREYTRICIRASWLALLCNLWLVEMGGNEHEAANITPYRQHGSTHRAKRINEAIDKSGLYEFKRNPQPYARFRKLKSGAIKRTANDPVANGPAPIEVTPWRDMFNYWLHGGLERDAKDLANNLPEENKQRIREELVK